MPRRGADVDCYVAIDLGAESGRVIAGRVGAGRVDIEEVHRFPNRPLRLSTGLHWNIFQLYADAMVGLRRCAAATEGRLSGVGVDAWAVDFALLDRDGDLIGIPFHYRDDRTAGGVEEVCARVPAAHIYATTGIQFLPINTVCQLMAMVDSPQLETAERLLLIPDLINYWLSGRAVSERTVASTTQMLTTGGDWAESLLTRLGLPTRILAPLVAPGTELAPLKDEVAAEIGVTESVPVIAVASHDTASAVAAIPEADARPAFISSGTWSLVGMELGAAVTTPLARELNLSNEAGVDGTVRFLGNVMGLWLLQECRRAWARQGEVLAYEALVEAAAACPPGPLIDPDDRSLLSPGDMVARIADACVATGQTPPEGVAAVTRCVLDSLACKYRLVLERVEAAGGCSADRVHLVGGGARNRLLCRLTADVLGRPVHVGPVEATALGNVMVQAKARGKFSSLAEIRSVVSDSVSVEVYLPGRSRRGAELLFRRFVELFGDAPSRPGVAPNFVTTTAHRGGSE